ncbi:PAS domain S-box protein [Thermodesulfobacteriota bacterium]
MKPLATWLGRVLAVAIVEFAAVKFGLWMALVHCSVSPVWPSTGVMIAAVMLMGYRVWPGIFVGSLLANLPTGSGIDFSIAAAVADTLEPVTAVFLIRRYIGRDNPLASGFSSLWYVVFAGMVATALSATIGVTSLCLVGSAGWADYSYLWGTWWLGNLMGAVLVAPVLIAWMYDRRMSLTLSRIGEAGLILALIAASGMVVFGIPFAPFFGKSHYPLAFLFVPIVCLTAFRFGMRGTVSAALLASIVALWATSQQLGPFVRESLNESILIRQVYFAVIAVTGMTLAGTLAERDKANSALRESEHRYRTLFDSAIDAIMMIDLEEENAGKIVSANRNAAEMHGYSSEELLTLKITDLDTPLSAKSFAERRDRVLKGERLREGTTRLKKDWTVFSIEVSASLMEISGHRYGLAIERDISERMRVEEKMKELNVFLNNVLESLTHPFYVINVDDYSLEMANSAALEGFALDEPTCHGLTHGREEPCDGSEHACPIREVRRTGEPVTLEGTHYDSSGKLRIDEIHAYPIFDDEGNLKQVIQYLVDITHRRELEIAREEANREKVQILEGISDGFFALDEDLVVKYFNSAAEKLLGRKREEVLGQKLFDAFPEARGSIFEEIHTQALKDKRPTSFETYFGIEPYINWYDVKVYPHEQGIAVYFQVTTERKLAEQALQGTNELLEKIFSITHYCLVFLDKEFNLVRVNQAYADACGHDPEFFVGKNHFDVYPHKENEAIFREVIQTREPYTVHAKPFEFPDDSARGVTYWDWTLRPVLDSEGTVEGLVFALLEVTHTKNAQSELMQHRDHLEEPVRNRTAELEKTNTRLRSEIQERLRAEETLRNRTQDLDERVKELNCLYGISKLTERPGISIKEVVRGIANLIPPSWQYPEITCARIALEEMEFETEKCTDIVAKQTSHVVIDGDLVGSVEVCYREERQDADEGPFLKEERRLIDAIAERLGRIIEGRRATEARKESEEKMRLITDALPVLISYVDSELRYRFTNKTYGAWHRFPSDRIHGKHAREVIGETIYERISPKLDQALSGKPVNYDIRFSFADGVTRDTSAVYVPHVGEDGKVKGIVTLVSDITERKASEEALRESEGRFRQLAENIQEVFWLVDPGPPERTVYVSPAYEKVWGRSREDLYTRARDWADAILDEDRESVSRSFDAFLLQTETRQAEYQYRVARPDGTIRWISDRAFLVQDGQGQVRRVAGLAQDVTRQKIDQERQLELMEEIRHFAYIVSHDLRAPLVNLRGFCDELEKDLTLIRPAIESQMEILSPKEASLVRIAVDEDIPESLDFIKSSVSKLID